MSAKIIIFEDRQDNNGVWIETNFDVKVMYFSKGFYDEKNLMVELPGTGQWQFDGIHQEVKPENFDEIWNIGQDFENNPENVIEGMLIAAHVIKAKQAFIYLRGEYEHLLIGLKKIINKMLTQAKSDLKIEIIVGAGSYVCGEETAIMNSIMGLRPHPYQKPPYPTQKGLWGKPTVINNVETLANVPLALNLINWKSELRLMSLSGNVTRPGIYELPEGIKLSRLVKLGKPKNKIKAVYFGCFGGCMPYTEIVLTPKNVCGKNCMIGAYTIIAVDEKQSILDISASIARFYEHESCGKCTPCREGTVRIYLLIQKIKSGIATKEDLDDLEELALNIHETSLCGLGQTATNHVLEELKYFKEEFEEKLVED